MKINTTDANVPSGVALHHGTRHNVPIWLMDNPSGFHGLWIEEDADGSRLR